MDAAVSRRSLLRNMSLDGMSPYLIQHRDNPVDWYPWGEEAFAAAQASDRPILLSVGYSTCHWCHVMERESFHNQETARYMNEHFVSVKVDREERPDVDSIYMDAVHTMTGRGGWPMTVFLDHEGRPFFAGTYFPEVDRHGMPGFRRVLEAINHAWQNRRGEVTKQADQLTRALGMAVRSAEELPGLERAKSAYESLAHQFDLQNGGFGGAPKFPQAPILEFLARISGRSWATKAPAMLTTTLTRMAQGGIRDHLGGGFARYSVDRVWLVPHFEKMLYDNADLARLYVRAWQITKNPVYREVAVDTLDYMMRDLRHPEGGFYAAEDADSEGVEGKFYVFTSDEFRQVVGEELYPVVSAYFGVSPDGNFEGANVLHQASTPEALSEWFDVTVEEVGEIVGRAKHRLRARQATRIRPGLDHKVITVWNGLALRSLAVAGSVLGMDTYLEAARANARFILSEMRQPDGRLARVWSNGLAPISGFLDDHAAYALGLLELYQATGEAEWFIAAQGLVDRLTDHFDSTDGVVFAVADDAGSDLVVRPVDQQDNPSASGASLAAECFFLMGRLTGEYRFHEQFERIVRAGDRLAEAAPSAVGHLLAVLATSLMDFKEVALCGPDALEWTGRLNQDYRPDLVLAPSTGPNEQIPILSGRYRQDRTVGYVCRNGVCDLPVESYEELEDLL
ncbi:MAG: thioredoxin domain-containing protein [Acidimicrobiia bacterium]|nr:thioredoxin domain-containing protein [Acidimicrobiia bacterium]MYF26842.1 thioredoxin domain-containing protein [Acidimicrobiia bacterium]